MFTKMRIYLMYQPLRVILLLRTAVFLVRLALLQRDAYLVEIGEGAGPVRSVIVGSALGITALLMFLLCLLFDLIARNRQLTEKILYTVRRSQVGDRRSELVDEEPKVKSKLPRAFGLDFLTSNP